MTLGGPVISEEQICNYVKWGSEQVRDRNVHKKRPSKFCPTQ